MKVLVRRILFLSFLFFAFGVCFGQEPDDLRPSDNYRIDAVTNRSFYTDGDVLSVTVKLFNNNPRPIWFLDDAVSDVDESRPMVIGFARLIRLRPGIETTEIAEVAPVEVFPLFLFGRRIVAGHSTRIVSVSGVRIFVEDDSLGEAPLDFPCVELSPGVYLLDCRVGSLAGSEVAQAQRIIRVGLSEPGPGPR